MGNIDRLLRRINPYCHAYENMLEKEKKVISIDLGIRTFATGVSENTGIEIGTNCQEKIRNILKRKDKILNNENIPIKIKKKNEKMLNKKVNNLTNELHWKTINYLTKTFETVIVGDINVKSIVRKNGNLSKMNKRIALELRFYTFKERLKYKCNISNTRLGCINEYMTSKMCSMCGNIKEYLGDSKMYKCEKCKMKADRDMNSARNILIRAIK